GREGGGDGVLVHVYAHQRAGDGELRRRHAREGVAHRHVEVLDHVVARGAERQQRPAVLHERLQRLRPFLLQRAAVLRRQLLVVAHAGGALFAAAAAAAGGEL